MVEPLVIIDVPAYESVNYLDEVEVIRAGVWQFLLDHPDTSGTRRIPLATSLCPSRTLKPASARF